jgi:tetratricopeptide (TPR) repeat protein
VKTWTYVSEWRDPRSVWFAAKQKTMAPEAFENLGIVYQDAGDRMDAFVSAGQSVIATNELPLARAVLGAAAQALETEWQAAGPVKTNSLAYRDRLWSLAWDEFESARKNLGTLSSPGLFLRRGKLLVSRGESERAIPELEKALQFARTHSYERIRQQDVTLITRALGIAYWNLGRYREALPWYEEALRAQRASGQVWQASLETELETLKRLAGSTK